MNKYIFLIAGMTLVTYIPRVLPFLFKKDIKEKSFIYRIMKLIPYTTLTALIIPGIFNSTGSLLASITGGFVAIGLAFYNQKIIWIIVGSIISVILVTSLV
ncbi:MAG: AzlD domain-containing protein [Bacillota bacterium]